MDNFTDFLTVFFVNNKDKNTHTPPKKASVKKASVKKASVKKASVKKASVKKASVKKASVKKASVKENEASVKENEASVKENEESVKKASVKKASVKKASVKKASVKKASVKENKESDFLSSLSSSLSSFSSYSTSNVKGGGDVNIMDTSEKKNELLKKYILKPSEFHKKNMLITNDNKKDSFDIISDILYKLSLLKNINDIYTNDLYIFTSNDNRKMFKKMLLDNPYLYFTNFYVKQKIQKNAHSIEELKEERKTIYIIDTEILSDIENLKHFINPKIHLILLTNDNNKIIDFYNLLGDKRILIHKQNKLKSMQRRFFKSVIKQINKDINFEDFYNEINNENIDVKYIILKENELRYN
jgi:hypothetical protein